MLSMNSWILPVVRSAVVLTIALAGPAIFALDDWQPITQEDLKMSSADAGNADAVILYHEVVWDDVRKHSTEYERIKIFTEKGKKYADIEIPYGKDGHFGTEIVDIKARTISPDGKVTPYSGKVFDKTVIKGHGLQENAKSFTLPDVQAGSIIEYRYAEIWTDAYVIAPHWILQENLAQRRLKYSYTPLSLDNHDVDMGHGEAADGVYHIEIGLPKGVALVTPNPNQQTMTLDMTNVPAYQEEEFSPPSEMMKMRVYFFYGDRRMLKPDDFWKAQGNYWNKEVEKFVGHSSAVSQAAAGAVSASDTPEQKVRKLYALVQKMNNLSYQEQNLADLLARKAPVSADQVLEQKAGYHDELTRLFVALVRSQNIPAYLMHVATREQTFFQANIPDQRQLNSEVAIVNVAEGKEVFLDPGARLCSFGLLEWRRTGTAGVRQRPGGGTELAKTPAPSYSDAGTQRVALLNLDHDGALKGKIVIFWLGQEGLRRRIEGARTDEAGRTKALVDELKSMLPSFTDVKLDSLDAWDDPDKPLKAIFSVELPGFATSTGKRLLLPAELFDSKQLFVHDQRKTPVYFDYPYRVTDRVQITLPPDVQVENLPQSEPAKADFAICSIERTAKGNVLELRRDFALGGVGFTVAEYPKVKSFFEKVHANDEEQVTLQLTPVAAGK